MMLKILIVATLSNLWFVFSQTYTPCIDIYPSECSEWVKTGLCENRDYIDYMITTCPVSCKICDGYKILISKEQQTKIASLKVFNDIDKTTGQQTDKTSLTNITDQNIKENNFNSSNNERTNYKADSKISIIHLPLSNGREVLNIEPSMDDNDAMVSQNDRNNENNEIILNKENKTVKIITLPNITNVPNAKLEPPFNIIDKQNTSTVFPPITIGDGKSYESNNNSSVEKETFKIEPSIKSDDNKIEPTINNYVKPFISHLLAELRNKKEKNTNSQVDEKTQNYLKYKKMQAYSKILKTKNGKQKPTTFSKNTAAFNNHEKEINLKKKTKTTNTTKSNSQKLNIDKKDNIESSLNNNDVDVKSIDENYHICKVLKLNFIIKIHYKKEFKNKNSADYNELYNRLEKAFKSFIHNIDSSYIIDLFVSPNPKNSLTQIESSICIEGDIDLNKLQKQIDTNSQIDKIPIIKSSYQQQIL